MPQRKTMNRSEQENLYRTSRKLSLVPAADRRRPSAARIFDSGAARCREKRNGEDLVLSVLRSPVNHVGAEAEDVSYGGGVDLGRRRPSCSEDDSDACEKLPFLQRLRGHRGPRYGEAHHKRVPTPLKRKQRFAARQHRSKDVVEAGDVDEDDPDDDDDDDVVPADAPRGVPDPYYPIYLPIDQAFKAKYVFHHKRGKTFQERTYVFLEHPVGWLCFIYHFTV